MEYNFQYDNVIIFEYSGRRWEIQFDIPTDEDTIQSHISKRISELEDDLNTYGDLDHSDLFVDYCEYKNDLEEYADNN